MAEGVFRYTDGGVASFDVHGLILVRNLECQGASVKTKHAKKKNSDGAVRIESPPSERE